ncbi:type IV secretory system conjugative DNA transfer family protein [Clostridium botulinum]|nr:type IV secretory system conjugative DNA transfer family protein [Clostridium botulinum]NFR14431.1 type IV secretory system conjugative DNA transfer family protein [Clostridium botulinum]NFR44805.1 type IV secretory system conjugative DNA transfer family protein [Clostridium botulinum]NFS52242.1 type IV secretory system conjugative DNA transfer family protein [Clostridium botulinum]
MDIIEQLKIFTLATGGIAASGEILSYFIRNKANRVGKLATAYIESKDKLENILGNTGLILSKDIQLKEQFDFEGSVTIAPTGSGKTSSFFFPNLLCNNIKGSIIVTDPKEELFKLTSKYQERICGRKVLKFSPLSPQTSEKYNLLTSCKDNSEVVELSSTLLFNGALSIELSTGKKTGGVEWIQMAEPLLAAALLYANNLEYPFNNIEFAFKLIINLDTEQLDSLFNGSNNIDCINQWNIFKTVTGADRTEGSIKITLASNMKLFIDNRINQVGVENTFDIEKFREEPTILYVCYPENKAPYLAPFIAPFFGQTLNKLIDSYEEDNLPITMLFDEFGNIGMLNNMSVNVATIRSRKISMNICLQSITQLFQTYGVANGKAILNNLKTKIILPGLSDSDTTNYLSDLCGNKEITICNTNVNKQNITHSYSKTKIKLFENSELRCLDDNQVLIITSNKQPILSIQDRYYTNSLYTSNIYSATSNVNHNNIKKIDIDSEIEKLKLEIIKDDVVKDVSEELFN